MTARGGVNRETGRVKDLAVAGMQGSPTVLFRIGPVMIHCGIGVAERQARDDSAVRPAKRKSGSMGSGAIVSSRGINCRCLCVWLAPASCPAL